MEAERQSRVRLGQRLEALRPQTSSQQRQAAAEATGTLFDVVSQSVGSTYDTVYTCYFTHLHWVHARVYVLVHNHVFTCCASK